MADRVMFIGSHAHQMLYDDAEFAPIRLEGEPDGRILKSTGGVGQFQPASVASDPDIVTVDGAFVDNAVPRFQGSGPAAVIEGTGVLIDDSDNITIPGIINAGSTPIDITTAAGYLRVSALNPGAGVLGDVIQHDGVDWVAQPISLAGSVDISDDTNLAVDAPIVLTDDTLSHADSGATPGTYRSVTVDAKGHVTAGTNPANPIDGTGTANTVAKWTDSDSLGNSRITDTGSGSVTIAAGITSQSDADTIYILGKGKLGYVDPDSDSFYISHFDHFSLTNFGLRCGPNGETAINVATGQTAIISVDGATRFSVTNTLVTAYGILQPSTNNTYDLGTSSLRWAAFYLAGDISQGPDTDRPNVFGRALLDSRTSDRMYLSHFDHTSDSGYAIAQLASGEVRINPPSGQLISFRVNNSPHMTMSNSNFSVGASSTFTLTMTGRLIVRSVSDAGPMTATAGTLGEIVHNTATAPDSFWGCVVTGSPATWVQLG